MYVMYSKEVAEVKSNYSNWLKASHMTEKELNKLSNVKDFTVLFVSDNVSDFDIVKIGYNSNNQFLQIGEQFIFMRTNKTAFLDLSFLLFYIAQKLDEYNEKAPMFERRKRYFYGKVKDFVNNEKKNFLL